MTLVSIGSDFSKPPCLPYHDPNVFSYHLRVTARYSSLHHAQLRLLLEGTRPPRLVTAFESRGSPVTGSMLLLASVCLCRINLASSNDFGGTKSVMFHNPAFALATTHHTVSGHDSLDVLSPARVEACPAISGVYVCLNVKETAVETIADIGSPVKARYALIASVCGPIGQRKAASPWHARQSGMRKGQRRSRIWLQECRK